MQLHETQQTELRRRLAEELMRIRAKNPAYSLRAFAKKVGVQPSALSELLNGKRGIAQKLALKIADNLLWEPEFREQIKIGMSRYHKADSSRAAVQLTMDNFHAISDWYHFAIISLAETQDFEDRPEWIAARLGISKTTAQYALERLERLGMLERGANGKLFSTGATYATSDEVASLALRKSHMQSLELARRSLEEDAIEARDFTAATMAIDPARLPEAKKMIRRFRAELCAFLEGGEKKEVMKLCVQLMPLSKTQGDRK